MSGEWCKRCGFCASHSTTRGTCFGVSNVGEWMLWVHHSARCFLSSRAIFSNEGRFDGKRSQLARMTFMSWPLSRLDGGSEGRMFSSGQTPRNGEGCYHQYPENAGKDRIMKERIPTQHEMPDGVVVREWPR